MSRLYPVLLASGLRQGLAAPQEQFRAILVLQNGLVYITGFTGYKKQPDKEAKNYYCYYIHFNGLFSGTTWVSQYQKGNTSLDLNEAKRWWGFGTAVASAGPYANNLHLAPDRQPQQHLITQFLPAGCSSWRQTNSVKALKVSQSRKSMFKSWHYYRSNDWINGESMSMPSDRGQLKNRTELLPLFRSSTWSPCESWPSTD